MAKPDEGRSFDWTVHMVCDRATDETLTLTLSPERSSSLFVIHSRGRGDKLHSVPLASVHPSLLSPSLPNHPTNTRPENRTSIVKALCTHASMAGDGRRAERERSVAEEDAIHRGGRAIR